MSIKRLKVFNTFVKELHSKLPESSNEFLILTNTIELDNFEKKYSKSDILKKNISFSFLNLENFTTFWSFFPKMYSCSIKKTKDRNSFLNDIEELNSKPKQSLESISQEMVNIIPQESIDSLIKNNDIKTPADVIALMANPNNKEFQDIVSKITPILQNKMANGQIDFEELSNLISK